MRMPFDFPVTIPLATDQHPGSFGLVRKNHIHEGVDLYCPVAAKFYAMVSGVVVSVIQHFAGPKAGSPPWFHTGAVMIHDDSGSWLYGEINRNPDLKVGSYVKEGDLIGHVAQIITKNRRKGMSMLHVERYISGVTSPVKQWHLNEPQPLTLVDPTDGLCAYQIIEKTPPNQVSITYEPVTEEDGQRLPRNKIDLPGSSHD
jgi:murein DD-endopeptidase MepM/ murein hydrolase activator NlpD